MGLVTPLIAIALLVAGFGAVRKLVPLPLPSARTALLGFAALVIWAIAQEALKTTTGTVLFVLGLLAAGLPPFAFWWWRRTEGTRRDELGRAERAALAPRRRLPPGPEEEEP